MSEHYCNLSGGHGGSVEDFWSERFDSEVSHDDACRKAAEWFVARAEAGEGRAAGLYETSGGWMESPAAVERALDAALAGKSSETQSRVRALWKPARHGVLSVAALGVEDGKPMRYLVGVATMGDDPQYCGWDGVYGPVVGRKLAGVLGGQLLEGRRVEWHRLVDPETGATPPAVLESFRTALADPKAVVPKTDIPLASLSGLVPAATAPCSGATCLCRNPPGGWSDMKDAPA